MIGHQSCRLALACGRASAGTDLASRAARRRRPAAPLPAAGALQQQASQSQKNERLDEETHTHPPRANTRKCEPFGGGSVAALTEEFRTRTIAAALSGAGTA